MRNPNIQVLNSVLPEDVVYYVIDKFFEYPKKKKVAPVSPSMQKELKKIQNMNIRNKPSNFMKGLEDFCLD